MNWNVTKTDAALISDIANRVIDKYLPTLRKMELVMDITAVHLNGNPLDLEALVKANEADFLHDVFGIRRYLDRFSGQLMDCFVPRHSRRASRPRHQCDSCAFKGKTKADLHYHRLNVHSVAS